MSTNRHTPEQLAARLLQLRNAESSFLEFVKLLYPDYNLAPFQIELINTLDLLERGELINPATKLPVYRLLINMPPRHAKSFFATQLFPVYYLARDPMREVMSTSYNSELAKTFGRAVKDTTKNPSISHVFPDFVLSDESRAVDHWRTTKGGVYYGIGMGGTTTGRAANLLIVDDPLKSRVEAESPTLRNQNWQYYVSALMTRKQPTRRGHAPIEIVILTRWHPDDLAGRIMETPDWKRGEWLHINYKALTIIDENIVTPRTSLSGTAAKAPETHDSSSYLTPKDREVPLSQEVALWPERFPVSWLKKIQELDPREFESLYQQSPFIAGGNLIKTDSFKSYKEPPTQDEISCVIITADTAFKAKEQSDYSVLLTAALLHSGDIYILDLTRAKLEFGTLKQTAIAVNSKWRGRGLRGLYIEDKASGQSLIQELRKESGISVLPYTNPSDKVARVNAVTPLIDGGRVFLPTPSVAPWLDNFLTECQQFPSSAHDDQVDALSMALDILSRIPTQSLSLLSDPITNLLTKPLSGELTFPPISQSKPIHATPFLAEAKKHRIPILGE